MGSGQETHFQAFSTVYSKSVYDQGPKRGITHAVCWFSNGQIVFIPTLYYTPGATTPKEEGPLHSGTLADAPTTLPEALLSLHHLSFGHMQGNTLGSNPIRQFKAVQGRFDPRDVRGSPTNR
jgi:hypothetical protein